MPAYARMVLEDFVRADIAALVGQLETGHARDGYATQYTLQTRAWSQSIPLLQKALAEVLTFIPSTALWSVLLEFPLYRLRKRIDAVLLTSSTAVVIEVKVGEHQFR